MADASTIARLFARRAGERRASAVARAARAAEALPALVALLASRGARRVWLFGSLAWGSAHEGSDIDLAVEGLPAEALWPVQGELLRTAPCSVDLVRIEEAPPALASRIRSEGRVLQWLSMTLALEDVRPAVLRRETARALSPVLGFRHFFRHAYAVAFDARRLQLAVEDAVRAQALLTEDLDAFQRTLRAAARPPSPG